jgi:CheY-like chemotaxis protein
LSRSIVAVCDDIFFWARIHAAAAAAGARAVRVADEAAMQAAWSAGGVTTLVADLSARGVDLMAWAPRWRELDPAPRLVGFASHVDDATQQRARAAGFDLVLPKSRFSAAIGAALGLEAPG